MNLEMPTPGEAGQLRTILRIVLGVLIVTIPVIGLIVVAKMQALRKQRPPQPPSGEKPETAAAVKPEQED